MSHEPPTITEHVARAVRATMTDEESRYAHDESFNAFLALDLDDADVLYVLTHRARAAGFDDTDAYIAGFMSGAHAVMNAPSATLHA